MKTRFNNLRIKAMTFLLCIAAAVGANDAVYFVNGSHLEPLQETDIDVKNEVLTITIGDDGFAYVDVDYLFMNRGQAKDVTMGFEANAPYNDGSPVDYKGIHPHIMDFSVVMNGKTLKYRNGLVLVEDVDGEKADNERQHFAPIDFKQWKYDEENSERFHNVKTDEYSDYAYAYYFDAHFNEGMNSVHHTYKYRMSYGVGKSFDIPYWLLPAMRWANHQIDDFTLRIRADKCTKHFIIDNRPFGDTPFLVTKGKGKTRKMKVNDFDNSYMVTEVVLRDGTLEWHRNNFRTAYNMVIQSADQLEFLVDWGTSPTPVYYDSGTTYADWLMYASDLDKYFPHEGSEAQTKKFAERVRHNLPYAHRGYVFKNAKLRRFFESQWWYMPDPSWQPTDNSFNQREREMIGL